MEPVRRWIRRWAAAEVDAQLRTARDEVAALRTEAEQLRAANRQVERRMRDRNAFLASLSHEVRSPLNGIIGFADLLASGSVPPGSPSSRRFIDHIHRSARHLLRLLNDVIALSRVDAGEHVFVPERVDAARLAADVLDLLHTRLIRRKLGVDIEVDPSVAELVLDPVGLKQALMSTLAVAIDASADGGRIAVRFKPEGRDRFRLEVQQSGGGRAPAARADAFDGFARQDDGAGRSPDDTGLGLALTRRLVEAQGGEVGAGVDELGSTWFLVLDKVVAPKPGAAAADAVAPVADPASGGGPATSAAPGAADVSR